MITEKAGEIEPGDIVQIAPEHVSIFAGCLVIVTEVKSWGVQGYVTVPARGDAYVRIETEEFQRVGRAAWTRDVGESVG